MILLILSKLGYKLSNDTSQTFKYIRRQKLILAVFGHAVAVAFHCVQVGRWLLFLVCLICRIGGGSFC